VCSTIVLLKGRRKPAASPTAGFSSVLPCYRDGDTGWQVDPGLNLHPGGWRPVATCGVRLDATVLAYCGVLYA
jgi:hypothetical protein